MKRNWRKFWERLVIRNGRYLFRGSYAPTRVDTELVSLLASANGRFRLHCLHWQTAY